MVSLDRKEAEEFYEVYRNVVPEYSQMVINHNNAQIGIFLIAFNCIGRRTRVGAVNCA